MEKCSRVKKCAAYRASSRERGKLSTRTYTSTCGSWNTFSEGRLFLDQVLDSKPASRGTGTVGPRSVRGVNAMSPLSTSPPRHGGSKLPVKKRASNLGIHRVMLCRRECGSPSGATSHSRLGRIIESANKYGTCKWTNNGSRALPAGLYHLASPAGI